jgi:hypothetical protein
MDEQQKKAVWVAFFDSQYRIGYFQLYSDMLTKQIHFYSFAIGTLSCCPLAALYSGVTYGAALSLVSGVLAATLGLWLASSDIASRLVTAKRALIEWNRANVKLELLWVDAQREIDVWQDYNALNSELLSIDEVVAGSLPAQRKMETLAYDAAEKALGVNQP